VGSSRRRRGASDEPERAAGVTPPTRNAAIGSRSTARAAENTSSVWLSRSRPRSSSSAPARESPGASCVAPALLEGRDGAIVVYCSDTACRKSEIAAAQFVAMGSTTVRIT
jgi:hypothetical protein